MLAASDKSADSGPIIEFLLQMIYDTLQEMDKTVQVKKLLNESGNDTLSARELMERAGLKYPPTHPAVQGPGYLCRQT
ncbi:MAG: hypothetical protein AAGU27_21965 [Dehalobacterium sp.]